MDRWLLSQRKCFDIEKNISLLLLSSGANNSRKFRLIFISGIFLAMVLAKVKRSTYSSSLPDKLLVMNSQPVNTQIRAKAQELGLREEIFSCALQMISQNRNLVNAIDHSSEMDDYIYQAIIRESIEKRKREAEENIFSGDPELQRAATKDLAILSREELTTDPFYRAVLPLLVKVVGQHQPILRGYAEEASAIVLELADFKRRHRSISFTEVIVKRCSAEIGNNHGAAA